MHLLAQGSSFYQLLVLFSGICHKIHSFTWYITITRIIVSGFSIRTDLAGLFLKACRFQHNMCVCQNYSIPAFGLMSDPATSDLIKKDLLELCWDGSALRNKIMAERSLCRLTFWYFSGSKEHTTCHVPSEYRVQWSIKIGMITIISWG